MSHDYFENLRRNSARWSYYIFNVAGLFVPRSYYRRQMKEKLNRLDGLSKEEQCHIKERVDYYNKLEKSFRLEDGVVNESFKVRPKKSAYHFDFYNIAKFFPEDVVYCYQFGDKTKVPAEPSFIKSRPIADGESNQNSVLLNLDKLRHYYRVADDMPFRDKKDIAVWRGAAHQQHRKEFLRTCYGRERLDVGAVDKNINTEQYRRDFMSLNKQLKYKFIISIEGNDVATNLKWIMSSNSLCLMRRPRYETWFMEGKLVPGVHYVEVKDDYSDINEKIEYYIKNPDEAEGIIKTANDYAERFYDDSMEELVSLLVFEKYRALCEN